MSAGFIAFIAALGCSAWVFAKLQNRTGYGNNKSAIIGAALVFVIAFVVVFTIGQSILK